MVNKACNMLSKWQTFAQIPEDLLETVLLVDDVVSIDMYDLSDVSFSDSTARNVFQNLINR